MPALTKPRLDPLRPSARIHADASRLLRDALSLYEVDEAALRRLRPDVVLTQDQCEVCAVDLQAVQRAVSRSVGGDVAIVSLRPDSLDGVLEGWRRVAAALGAPEAGERLVKSFRRRLASIREATRARSRPRVLCLEWPDPPMVAGNWVPELVAAAGGEPVLAEPGRRSPAVTWAGIAESDPGVVVVMACGFDMQRTRSELEPVLRLPAWRALRAVREGRAFVTDGNAYFNRPGPRTLATLEALAQMLHPDLGFGHQGRVWRPLAPSQA